MLVGVVVHVQVVLIVVAEIVVHVGLSRPQLVKVVALQMFFNSGRPMNRIELSSKSLSRSDAGATLLVGT